MQDERRIRPDQPSAVDALGDRLETRSVINFGWA